MRDRDHRQERGDLVHKHCPHCDPKDWVIHTDDVPAWEKQHRHGGAALPCGHEEGGK